ncbi:MAG TPA: methylmalonyl Co-A mutase-associated GTPase MeaB [Gemmatimonadales bacterium]
MTAAATALLARLRRDDQAGLSRAISLVENEVPGFEDLLRAAQGRAGTAHRIGITGPPGAGKSTLTHQLARWWRAADRTVGIVAVDPTSPLTGGALLGDRIRMAGVALDPGVFIRSMATRGALGGLALATREVCDLLDAAGYERVVVETVGVGQSELDVVAAADTVVLVLTPESGDGIQALKSGLMEVADVFVVNKADRTHAERMAREIRIALELRTPPVTGTESGWAPPILLTVADRGEGTPELAAGVEAHHAWLVQSGELARRRRRRAADQTRSIVERALVRWARGVPGLAERLANGEARVAAGEASPYDVAAEMVQVVSRKS